MDSIQSSAVRRVAIYGRVSTEHEAQLSAFENQQAWYEGVARLHPEWVIIARYYDEGITGTAAEKRPEFMRMLKDAQHHEFDLIVTREVCRFARNTVDTLTVTRNLKQINIEVYFISDNIWTLDNDGELRLTIMATLAQEESRKTSERVRAGQQISREKGSLYGNGNILGYNRVNGTYVINSEQAYCVRKIFELYASGMGYKRICGELIRLGCKNAHGEVKWNVDRIGRMLRNATYKGYIGYNKSHSDGYLTQKRINHRDEEFVYIKGDFEPIVSEELWQKCADLRQKKSSQQIGADGKTRRFCRKGAESVWSAKLRCSCGSSMRRFLWHQREDGHKEYGFECYRKKREVSVTYAKAHGLDAAIVCQSKSIPFWHIDLMARDVFKAVWQDRKEAVLLTYQMLEECATRDTTAFSNAIEMQKQQIEKLQKKQTGLRSMCAIGDISREEFLRDNEQIKQELQALELQIADLQASATTQGSPSDLDLEKIRATLNQWIDFSLPAISDALIEQFILQVVIVDDNTFNWTLDFSGGDDSEQSPRMRPNEIALQLYREQQKRKKDGVDTAIDTMLSRHITNPRTLFSFTVTAAEAAEYCKSIGIKFFGKKWQDKTVIVSI